MRCINRFTSLLLSTSLALVVACGDDGPGGQTFYEREIEPILSSSCARNTGGCHSINDNDPFAFAAGNFDVTSFEAVQKRRDILQRFGSYNQPLLLIKAVGNSGELGFTYDGEFRTLEIQHTGGAIFGVGSSAYLTLLSWTDKGATENGLPPESPARTGEGGCFDFIPLDFDAAAEAAVTADPNFGEFVSNVQPVLEGCNASNCHGAPQADFYITCGDNERQRAFNFSQTHAFVDDPVANSQILRQPLAVSAGGFYHTGGEHFLSTDDNAYSAIKDWAAKVGKVAFGAGDAAKEYFAANVQPILINRGCMFEACHSPQATNDFQLRAGTQGFISAIALERNYDKMHNLFMALEVPDARRGRAVSKTILSSFGGINHRGGPVLETQFSGGADPMNCIQPIDPLTSPAYCVVQEWLDITRAELVTAGELDALAPADSVPIVYIDRDVSHVATPLQFDTYQPGSDLMVADALIATDGSLSVPGAPRTLLDGCGGIAVGVRTGVDVSAPDVHRDGNQIVFAMRLAANEPRQVWRVNLDGSNCSQVSNVANDPASVSGILIHNFDPAWSPDGAYIVYASTRGVDGGTPAPTVSRRLFLPQSDIWRMDANGTNPERMTYLSNSEISPQFMREGRVIMTTEKVSQGFYQLSGRRINWDRTDYHPLLAQRANSVFSDPTDPTATNASVGYEQATEIREGFNGSFLTVFSDRGARGGAGTLAIFNRSVGPFELGRNDPGFLQAVTFPDTAATGRVGSTTNGAYRSPFPLLDGQIMASYSGATVDLATATSFDWDIVAVNRRTGARTTLIGGAGAQVEAVLALKKLDGELYINRRQLVFGGEENFDLAGSADQAVVHFPDAPLIFTLLNANLRRGRPADLFREATHIAFYEENKAPAGTTSPNAGEVYEDRRLIGRAPLASDGSVRVRVPSSRGLIMELQTESGGIVVTMNEEHQLGPGESISFGIIEPLFDAVCGGCHGTVSGRETDVFVSPDVLTGASESLSREQAPITIQ